MEFHAPAIVGAGGYLCPVATSLVVDTYEETMVDRKHYCGGYREYWDGVTGCEGNIGDIEIHFVDTIIPDTSGFSQSEKVESMLVVAWSCI